MKYLTVLNYETGVTTIIKLSPELDEGKIDEHVSTFFGKDCIYMVHDSLEIRL